MEDNLEDKAPIKVACFGWIAALGTCLSQDNLRKRGFSIVNGCYFVKRSGIKRTFVSPSKWSMHGSIPKYLVVFFGQCLIA